MNPDIATRQDIERLVDTFYGKVQTDTLLGPVFAHVNWPEHLPVMYNFWSSVLFGDQSYRGNPLQKHFPLDIRGKHFRQWLKLFTETVDENFAGEKANEVKMRAGTIAEIFKSRLGLSADK